MDKKTKKILMTTLLIIVFAGIVVGAYFGYKKLSGTRSPSGQGTIKNKGDYKNFTMTDVDGNEVKLSDYIGKPVIINFWASWCPPCKAELPHFEKLAKEYKGQVHFLMVNVESNNKDAVKNFVKSNGYTFPLYFDKNESGSNAYSVQSIPLTVFITADGKIGERRLGAMSEAVLRDYIKQLLK